MKKVIITISIFFFSFSAFAQLSKADSIKQVELNKQVAEIVTKTSVREFREWLYERMPAKSFNEFEQYFSAFINQKLVADKPKPTK